MAVDGPRRNLIELQPLTVGNEELMSPSVFAF